MSFPEPAAEIHDFTTTLPDAQHPGSKLNQSYADLRRISNGTLDCLRQIQDDDGELGRGTVGIDQLQGGLIDALIMRFAERLAEKAGKPLSMIFTQEFEPDGATDEFTLSRSVPGSAPLLVMVHGDVQRVGSYTAAGNTITFSEPPPAGSVVDIRLFDGDIPVDPFIGNGVETTFTLTRSVPSATWAIVSVSGVVQAPSSYRLDGATLKFNEPPPVQCVVEVRFIWSLPLPASIILEAKCCC